MAFQAKHDFNKAENCYIAAKDPEKAIVMYQEAGMFGDAVRVAQKHAPHLVDQINDNYNRDGPKMNQSPQEILNSGKIYEEQREYSKAVERYMQITEGHLQNKEQLEEIWNNAFNLAMNYAKDKVNDVVQILAPRMINIGKFESAAEIYEAVALYDKAIEAYMEVKKWDRAMECAHQVRPMEMQQLYVQKINQRKKDAYIAGGKINKIIEGGDLSGLELLAQEGRWEECLQIAEK
jgi:intraflagellar transport protein 172